jgi:hypothetical protein
MLLKKDFEGVFEQFLFKMSIGRQIDFKKAAPMIRLLRVGSMPPTFSTASTQLGPFGGKNCRVRARVSPTCADRFHRF